jgi:hypothetical protein
MTTDPTQIQGSNAERAEGGLNPEATWAETPIQQRVAAAQRAAAHTDTLGPGTAGHTISGAAYRGTEVAAHTGASSPAEPGFQSDHGLGYAMPEPETGYPPTKKPEQKPEQ